MRHCAENHVEWLKRVRFLLSGASSVLSEVVVVAVERARRSVRVVRRVEVLVEVEVVWKMLKSVVMIGVGRAVVAVRVGKVSWKFSRGLRELVVRMPTGIAVSGATSESGGAAGAGIAYGCEYYGGIAGWGSGRDIVLVDGTQAGKL